MEKRMTLDTNGRAPARVDYADALRGLACLWVVLCHGWWLGYLTPTHHPFQAMPTTLWEVPASIGYLGVSLFLTLSGFCLFYPLARKGSEAPLDVRRFAARRIRRILPPYFVVLVLLVVLELSPYGGHVLGRPGKEDVITHALLVENLFPPTPQHRSPVYSINPVFWSLALEWQWYFFFPVMAYLIRRMGLARTFGAAFAITTVWLGACLLRRHVTPSDAEITNVLYGALPGRLSEFVAGMVAAALVTRDRPLPVRRGFIAAFGLACAAPALYLVSTRGGGFSPEVWQMLGLAWASLLVFIGTGPQREPGRLNRALVWVGGISYSLYLTHYPLMEIANPWLASAASRSPLLPYVLFYLVLVPLAIAVAWCFWWCTERPFLGRSRPAVAPAAIA
jgi:peptidoglycan/LPS O-acetylase OafA/YrhL